MKLRCSWNRETDDKVNKTSKSNCSHRVSMFGYLALWGGQLDWETSIRKLCSINGELAAFYQIQYHRQMGWVRGLLGMLTNSAWAHLLIGHTVGIQIIITLRSWWEGAGVVGGDLILCRGQTEKLFAWHRSSLWDYMSVLFGQNIQVGSPPLTGQT